MVLVEPHGVQTLAQREQGGVDVSRLFETLTLALGASATLGSGQVTETEPVTHRHTHTHTSVL